MQIFRSSPVAWSGSFLFFFFYATFRPQVPYGLLGTRGGGGGALGEREIGVELELETLFYKDCSLGSVKNLSNN